MNKFYVSFYCIKCKYKTVVKRSENISFSCPECNINISNITKLLSDCNTQGKGLGIKPTDIDTFNFPQMKIKKIYTYKGVNKILNDFEEEFNCINKNLFFDKNDFINLFIDISYLNRLTIDLISFMDLKLKDFKSVIILYSR